MIEPTPFDAVLEAVQRIDALLATVPQDRTGEASEAIQQLVWGLQTLFTRPEHLEIEEHQREAAVALASCYLDPTEHHALLANTLAELDTRGLGNPGYRLGLLAALAQLVVDSLVLAIAIGTPDDMPDIPESMVLDGCRDLLQRLALSRITGQPEATE